ncbi:MAG: outer membrane beta-barrel protein [Verrucomicrobiota bacterium]
MKKSKLKIGVLVALLCFCSSFAGAEDLGTGMYAPTPFHVTVSVRGGFDDNVSTTAFDPVESWFVNASIALHYDFNSPRTQLVLGAGAGITSYFEDIPGQDDFDKNIYISLALNHKASARLILSLVAYATYQSQPDFTLALGINRRSGNYFYTLDKFTATYLWTPRFSTATSYTLGAIRYAEGSVGFFEDRIENTFGNEFRFLVQPTTTLVAEYRFQFVTYSNIDRDSTAHYFLAGLDHSFSPRFNVSLRGGYEIRDYDNNGTLNSPYFEGTLNYAVAKQTSLSWTTRYGTEASDVELNQSRKTFRTGLLARHNFTPRFSGALAVYYQHDAYDGIDTPFFFSSGFDEDSIDFAASLRYALTRSLSVEVGYNHTEVTSDDVFREYSRNRYWSGLNFSF